ncbi:hypothetical protein JW960_20545 [candidate division KSB1 bacterium]|nr:hypothetical protein [candidate division KSB1 bacterium]
MNKIQQEIQKTLKCFDQVEPLKADPFFYTRLRARIKDQNANTRQVTGWNFAWNIVKPALLVGIVVANIVTVIVFMKDRKAESYSRQQLLEMFGQETMLDSNQYDSNLISINQE